MNRPIWQRIGAVLCCLLFICCFGYRISVDAVFTEGVVIGGTMAATEAALGEATTVAIGSSGLTDQMRSAADAAGQSVQEWVNDRIAAYNSVASGSTLLPIMAADMMRSLAYTPEGELIFSRQFADAFSSFMDWLIQNGDIQIEADSYSLEDVSLSSVLTLPADFSSIIANNVYVTEASSGAYRFYYQVSSVNCFALYCTYGTSFYVIFASDRAFSYGGSVLQNYNENTSPPMVNASSTYQNEGKTVYYGVNANSFSGTLTSYESIPINALMRNIYSSDFQKIAWSMIYNATSTGSTDGLDVWNDSDDGVVVDPTALLGDAIAGLQGAIANVGDYIATLADVIGGVQNPALPVVGVGEIPISIPADITIPVNPAIPADRVDDVPATGEDTMPAYTGTGDYTLPLSDFFPFCIPFDIYKMLSLLSAAPVAPSVDYPFPLPGGGTYTIHIDLSQFDPVAQVLRTIETLAFCVGLGIVTKKLLFGS